MCIFLLLKIENLCVLDCRIEKNDHVIYRTEEYSTCHGKRPFEFVVVWVSSMGKFHLNVTTLTLVGKFHFNVTTLTLVLFSSSYAIFYIIQLVEIGTISKI